MFAGFQSVSESHYFLLLICHHICDHPIVWLWKHGSIWLNWFHSLWCLRTKSWMFGETILVQILCRNCSLWCLMQHICEFAVWGNQFQNKYSHIFGNKYPLCVQQILSNVSKQIPSMCATNTIKLSKQILSYVQRKSILAIARPSLRIFKASFFSVVVFNRG